MDSTRAQAKLVAAFDQGDWPRVLHRAAQVLSAAPGDANVHFMVGVAHLQTGRMPLALDALLNATQLDPGNGGYLAHYAKALAQARRLPEACVAAERAMSLLQGEPLMLDMIGTVFLQANEISQATAAFRRAVEIRPEHPPFHFNLAYALTAMGDIERAEYELEACLRLEPRHWPTHLSLANLKRQTPAGQHTERLCQLLDKYGSDRSAQIFLNMALGKEYEDLARYPLAFEHFSRGKAAARSLSQPSADRDQAMFESLTRAFPAERAEPRASEIPDGPIFIIGMPRTGTTLLDRMVSSHPDVYSAGELQNFPTVLQRASNSSTALLALPDLIAHTRHIDWHQLGSAYIESTLPATACKPRFIDKMPLNFLYAGFIARALPNARFICLRRDPMDTCLSNFRNLFQAESGFYDYSLDLLDTGRYYIQFERLMVHWHNVLPGRILDVRYESLVQMPEPSLRRVLDFCHLPWNESCIHSESNVTPVNTPNAWQVRAPIYKTAVGSWRRYADQTQGLRELLVTAGISVPEQPG